MKNLLLPIILCLSLVSCKSFFVEKTLDKLGVLDEKSKPEILYSNNKKVVLIGMHHIGKQNFYDDVKFKVDSLRNLDFHFLYEGITYDSDFPEEQRHTYSMKIRKIIGFSKRENFDTITNKIAGKIKVDKKHNLINQPKYLKLGIDLSVDEKADLPPNILIDKFEEKFGEIELDDCDYRTPLTEDYNCPLWKKGDKNYLML